MRFQGGSLSSLLSSASGLLPVCLEQQITASHVHCIQGCWMKLKCEVEVKYYDTVEKLRVQSCAVNSADANSSCSLTQRIRFRIRTGPPGPATAVGGAEGSVCDLSLIYLPAGISSGQKLSSTEPSRGRLLLSWLQRIQFPPAITYICSLSKRRGKGFSKCSWERGRCR